MVFGVPSAASYHEIKVVEGMDEVEIYGILCEERSKQG